MDLATAGRVFLHAGVGKRGYNICKLMTTYQVLEPSGSKNHVSLNTEVQVKGREHGDIFARRKQCVVRISARHDGAEHDRLVGLVLEIPVVQLIELGSHLLELFLGGSNLKRAM